MNSYKKERESIDAIDRKILVLLSKRSDIVGNIGSKKLSSGASIKDPDREKELLSSIEGEAEKLGLSSYHVKRIYREILGYSVNQQDAITRIDSKKKAKIAYLGIAGSNTYSAAAKLYDSAGIPVKLAGYSTVKKVFEAIVNKEADYGVVPIENTTAGSINEVYDLLYRSNLWIVAEEKLRIKHCLLAKTKVTLENIRTVISHPQALKQCSDLISQLADCKIELSSDTASAAETVSKRIDKNCAAIASKDAAATYNLEILKENLGNQRENHTRFIVISRQPARYYNKLSYKTSLLLAVQHQAGALEQCLRILSENGINMSKLESRPRPNMPWEYMFYIDIDGASEEPKIKEAINSIREYTSYIKILGSYPLSISKKDSHLTLPSNTRDKSESCVSIISKSGNNKLVELADRKNRTLVSVNRDVLIGKGFTVIAGPCAVESRGQIVDTAAAVKQAGAHILRGGVYKPRTSPYSFQGLGEEGVRYLTEAGKSSGMPTVTEVMNLSQVDKLASSVDMLQVGARNMQNYPLLSELGKIDKPVLLKRSMMASIDELLMAAEYIVANGNSQVVLCERGIRTFETATRNTLDLSAVVVLKERSHLPVIVDPSHAVGVARWIAPLAKAALACGADGIMVEVHPDPDNALCDGKQALRPEEFTILMEELTGMKSCSNSTTASSSKPADVLWQPVGW